MWEEGPWLRAHLPFREDKFPQPWPESPFCVSLPTPLGWGLLCPSSLQGSYPSVEALASLSHTIYGNFTLCQPTSEGRAQLMTLVTYCFGNWTQTLELPDVPNLSLRISLLGKPILLIFLSLLLTGRRVGAEMVGDSICTSVGEPHGLLLPHLQPQDGDPPWVDPPHTHTHSGQEQAHPDAFAGRRAAYAAAEEKGSGEICSFLGVQASIPSSFSNTISISFKKVISFPTGPSFI